eukprot:jgi/Galph1/444/GphlegSOOS_G5281.1
MTEEKMGRRKVSSDSSQVKSSDETVVHPTSDAQSCEPSIHSEQDWKFSQSKRPLLPSDRHIWSISRLCTAFELWRKNDISKTEKVRKITNSKLSRVLEKKLGSSFLQQLSSLASSEHVKRTPVHWEDVERLYEFCGPYLSLPQANIAGFLELVGGHLNNFAMGSSKTEFEEPSKVGSSPRLRVESDPYTISSVKEEDSLATSTSNSRASQSPEHKRARTHNMLSDFTNSTSVAKYKHSNNHSEVASCDRSTQSNMSPSEVINQPSMHSRNAFISLKRRGNSFVHIDQQSSWDRISSTRRIDSRKTSEELESSPNNTNMNQIFLDTKQSDERKTISIGSKRSARGVLEQILSMDTGIVKWCLIEFFDAFIDRSYLNFSEFSDVLYREMGVDSNILLRPNEWRMIRKEMCELFSSSTKPRRLSQKFLAEERERLKSYRLLVRQYLADPRSVVFYPWAPCPYQEITVGSKVIVRNWKRCEVHSASILAASPERGQMTVKFDDARIPSSNIKDTDVMVASTTTSFYSDGSATAPSHYSSKDISVTFETLAKKLRSLKQAEDELDQTLRNGHPNDSDTLKILRLRSNIAFLNLECDELFLCSVQTTRSNWNTVYLDRLASLIFNSLAEESEPISTGLQSVILALIKILACGFHIINFRNIEIPESTCLSTFTETVRLLEKQLGSFYRSRIGLTSLRIKYPVSDSLESLTAQVEGDLYPVPDEYFKKTNEHFVEDIKEYRSLYTRSVQETEEFWSEMAKSILSWQQLWENEVCRYNFDVTKGPVFCEWFKGGKLNACYNAVDRHVEAGFGSQVALYAEANDENDDVLPYTYEVLLENIKRLASGLKQRGVKKGDVVAIYMPNIPELIVAMLACARIGAIHNVVFAGFSAESLANRLLDANCRVLITCDGFRRGEKLIPLKNVADAAEELLREATGSHLLTRKIIYQRLGEKLCPISMSSDTDEWWHDVIAGSSNSCELEWMDAEDPLFVLYTSGSTGKPKGIVHSTAGYLLYSATTYRYAFNYHPGDVYFCTADCGWITGHSYIVYGPLVNRATQVLFEGVPTFPDASRLWKITSKYHINQLYTAPTLIRSLMRAGENYVRPHDRSTLSLLGTVGEPINPEAWKWFSREVGENRCPIVDTWWQTETGGHMILPPPVMSFYQKPGSAGIPFFGVIPTVLNEKGEEMVGPCEGYLCIKKPWPGMLRTVLGDHSRMESTYFKPFPGLYMSGDGCRRDENGYYWLTGRVDDVLNVSGHRIGTAEVESALVAHGAVAEAAVVPVPHEIKGQGVYAFVTLREGEQPSEKLRKELKNSVREHIGAICTPDVIHWAPSLPKTRSGKIMRRILRKIAELGNAVKKEELGDISTLSEPRVVDELVELYGI